MRVLPGLGVLGVFGVLAACGGADSSSGPEVPATIRVTTTVLPPVLVAFREGVTGPWQTVTATSPTTPTQFEFAVQHPYEVSVVCRESSTDVRLWQLMRTPDDPHDESVPCGSLDDSRRITGHMVQAGQVTLASTTTISPNADWNFSVTAEPGTYDLVARSDAQIAIRRGIVVAVDDVALTPAIDVVRDGTAFTTAAFSATNLAADETSSAVAYLENSTLVLAADLPVSPLTAVKLAPQSVLAPGDTQRVEVRARRGAQVRALLRPYQPGADTAYTLPPAIADLRWTVDAGQLSATWSSLPDRFRLDLLAFGAPNAAGIRPLHLVLASADFLATTATTQLTVATDLPNFQSAWKLDFARGYQRHLEVDLTQGTTFAHTTIDELVPATP